MRTVLLTAACTVLLAFSAHGADLPAAPALPPVPDASACVDNGATISHASFTPAASSTDADAECCAASSYCPQYLSTQTLVTPPATGHT